MLNNKNVIRKKIQMDNGKKSSFDVYLQGGATADIQKKPKNKHDMNITEKSELVYKQATDIVDALYKNPENLANYQKAQDAVRELVALILDDDFALRSLMSIATHDYYTHTHSLNVSVYAVSLGMFLGLRKRDLRELGEAALLHDLGKNKIKTSIINKDGKLTDLEYEEVKHHSEYGFEISEHIGIKNKRILEAIKYHHEKLDGSGYPDGLKGEDIPLFARIIGVCDIFDALSSKRSYKDAMQTFDVLKLMKTKMKDELDMELLNKMITMFR